MKKGSRLSFDMLGLRLMTRFFDALSERSRTEFMMKKVSFLDHQFRRSTALSLDFRGSFPIKRSDISNKRQKQLRMKKISWRITI